MSRHSLRQGGNTKVNFLRAAAFNIVLELLLQKSERFAIYIVNALQLFILHGNQPCNASIRQFYTCSNFTSKRPPSLEIAPPTRVMLLNVRCSNLCVYIYAFMFLCLCIKGVKKRGFLI